MNNQAGKQKSEEARSPMSPGSTNAKVKPAGKMETTKSKVHNSRSDDPIEAGPVSFGQALGKNKVTGGIGSVSQLNQTQKKDENNNKNEIELLEMERNAAKVRERKSAQAMEEQEMELREAADGSAEEGNEPEPSNEDDPSKFRNHHYNPDNPQSVEWYTYSPKSIFCLRHDNCLRLRIIWVITHKWFDNFIIMLIGFNSLLLGIKDYTDDINCSSVNTFVESMEPLFMWSFLIECCSKILGMGFILDSGSYLRDAWNWLDFVVVLSSLLTEIPAMRSVSGMRTFRLMRPLRTLTTMPSMRLLISTLMASVAQLGGVLVLAMFFFTIFAILGVSLWSGSINKRCRLTQYPIDGDWEADPADTRLCSDIRMCPINRWCGSLAEASRSNDPIYALSNELKLDYYRDAKIEDLNFSITNFDNLPQAFLTIFQCITLEGWIDVTNMFEDSYTVWFVEVYFLLCIIVCSFFVLNLTIAVMLLKYEEYDKENQDGSEHMQELHEYGEKIGLPLRFTEFLIDQDNIQISLKGLKVLQSQKQESLWKMMITSTAKFEKDDRYYNNALTRVCFYTVNSPIFNGFIIFIIVLNTIVLSMDGYPPQEKEVQQVFDVANVVFTVIFTAELIVKVIGLGTSGFLADKFNIFDGLIVIISLVEMALAGDDEGSQGGALSALRAFRLFRIFKIFRAGDLRTLLDSIAFTVVTIKDYTILLALFIYVFALLGMSIFAGKVTFDEHGDFIPITSAGKCEDGKLLKNNEDIAESPRTNYDHVTWAMLAVFEIMIGENWNGVMYDHMRTIGSATCVYFIALVCMGNIIMLNLFLAILLGNFDRARNFGEKKKIFDAFGGLNDMGYDLLVSITNLFDDPDLIKYIEDKVLSDKKEQGDKAKDAKKGMAIGFDEVVEIEYTEKEIIQVYKVMTKGQIELLLSGETRLEDLPLYSDENCCVEMTLVHRERVIEILNYVKRQANLRKQRVDFQVQLKRTQVQREALDKMFEKEDEMISTESDNEQMDQTLCEALLDHIKNSSLLIFHQNSKLRGWCQLCVQNDDDEQNEAKKDTNAGSSAQPGGFTNDQDDNMGSTPNNKVGVLNDKHLDGPPNKFRVKNKSQKDQNSAQISVINQSMKKASITMRPGSASVSKTLIVKKATGGKNIVAKIFEGIILTLIMISSLALIIDNPQSNPDSDDIIFVSYMDNCFTILFFMEMTIKIIAMGFLFSNSILKEKGIDAYILNPWNMLDFVVVIAALIDLYVTISTSSNFGTQLEGDEASSIGSSLQSVKALRALRALRPLRMISRNKGMKLIVNALLSSIPSMSNVAIVCGLFLLIFAIIGVDQFKGKFDKCSIDDEDLLVHIITRVDCNNYGGTWEKPDENFDNAVMGIRTLFEMMSTEGWIDVMDAGTDSVGIDMQPKKNNNIYMVFFFVFFMIVGSQFILNLFVGVIMDNFNKIKEKEEWGSLFVTEDQRAWIDAQRLGLAKKLSIKINPPAGIRGHFFKLVNHNFFEGFITSAICLNTVVMGLRQDGLDPLFENLFEKLNYVFAFIFNVEMILKLIGLDNQYFYSSWNIFDMIVVFSGDAGIILKFVSSGSSFSSAATVVRAFRIMRIVRLVRSQPDVKIILDTLVNIVPQITNFITLMFLLLFIYAALGINLFSGIHLQDYITEKNNFRQIGTAIVYLFRSSTGEDWNKIMHELGLSNADDPYACVDEQDYFLRQKNNGVTRACGDATMSQIYMISFTVIISWLIMNLSVASVIEGLENAKQQNDGTITGDDVQSLLDGWQEYDPSASGWISVKQFICLLIELPPPFGNEEFKKDFKHMSLKKFQKKKNLMYNKDSFFVEDEKMIIIKNKDILKILQNYKIQTYEGMADQVHFKDIYQILVKKAFKKQVVDFEISKYLKTKMKNQWTDKHLKKKSYHKASFKAHQGFASKIITEYAKRYRLRKNEKKALEESIKKDLEPADKFSLKKNDPLKKNVTPSKEDGDIVLRDDKNLKRMKTGGQDFKIGFVDPKGGKDLKKKRMTQGRTINDIGESPRGDETQFGTLPPITQKRQKYADENPQEFEELDQGETLPVRDVAVPMNFNRPQHPVDDNSENESMQASHQNLHSNFKMGQSITESNLGKSINESNVNLLQSPKNNQNFDLNDDNIEPVDIARGNIASAMTHNMPNLNNQLRSRSHQQEQLQADSRQQSSASNEAKVVNIQIGQREPPKTAQGQVRVKPPKVSKAQQRQQQMTAEETKKPNTNMNNFF